MSIWHKIGSTARRLVKHSANPLQPWNVKGMLRDGKHLYTNYVQKGLKKAIHKAQRKIYGSSGSSSSVNSSAVVANSGSSALANYRLNTKYRSLAEMTGNN